MDNVPMWDPLELMWDWALTWEWAPTWEWALTWDHLQSKERHTVLLHKLHPPLWEATILQHHSLWEVRGRDHIPLPLVLGRELDRTRMEVWPWGLGGAR